MDVVLAQRYLWLLRYFAKSGRSRNFGQSSNDYSNTYMCLHWIDIMDIVWTTNHLVHTTIYLKLCGLLLFHVHICMPCAQYFILSPQHICMVFTVHIFLCTKDNNSWCAQDTMQWGHEISFGPVFRRRNICIISVPPDPP